MTEKDIKIEGEETVDAVDAENTENAEQTEATGAENEKSADKESEAEEKDPLVKAQEEVEELKDKWLRSVAEFETLIHQKFMKTLEAQGVSKIETKDADFDTDVHEAVAMVPGMGDDKKGKVIDCLQEGYKLNDKVIRHAKVAVGQ